MGKSILITGGFGFIGGYLVELLAKDKTNSIYVVDNLSTNPIPLDNFMKEAGHPENLRYDICSVEEYCKSIKKEFHQSRFAINSLCLKSWVSV